MTTIFKEKAEQIYDDLATKEKNLGILGEKKKQFEAEAVAARKDETRAKQSVSRALLNGDEAAAEAFRKTARERGEFAEEREGAAKEAEAAVNEAKQAIYCKKQEAERAGYFALKEHSLTAMQKMRPHLQMLLEMVAAHDREQSARRPGQDRHSSYSRLFQTMAYWFEIGKWNDPNYILRKFEEEFNSALNTIEGAVAAGISSQEEAETAKAEFLTRVDLGTVLGQTLSTSTQTVELASADVEVEEPVKSSTVHPRHQARHERARRGALMNEFAATLGSATRKRHEPESV